MQGKTGQCSILVACSKRPYMCNKNKKHPPSLLIVRDEATKVRKVGRYIKYGCAVVTRPILLDLK